MSACAWITASAGAEYSRGLEGTQVLASRRVQSMWRGTDVGMNGALLHHILARHARTVLHGNAVGHANPTICMCLHHRQGEKVRPGMSGTGGGQARPHLRRDPHQCRVAIKSGCSRSSRLRLQLDSHVHATTRLCCGPASCSCPFCHGRHTRGEHDPAELLQSTRSTCRLPGATPPCTQPGIKNPLPLFPSPVHDREKGFGRQHSYLTTNLPGSLHHFHGQA